MAGKAGGQATGKKLAQILIHVGYQKCGSKSIQNYTNINRKLMKDHGIATIKGTKIGNSDLALMAYGGVPSRISSMKSTYGLPESATEEDVYAAIEKKIDEDIAAFELPSLFFSYEGLLRLPKEGVERIIKLLSKYTDTIKVLAIVRRQDRQCISGYTTRLRNSDLSHRSIFYNLNNQIVGIDYFKHLNFWNRQVGRQNMTVLAFEDMTDVSFDFAEWLGMDPTKVKIPPRQNPSLSAQGQEVLRAFNEQYADKEPWKKHRQTLRTILRDEVLPKGSPLLPASKDVEAYMDNFKQGNRRLMKKYLKDGTNYNNDIKKYPDEMTPYQLEDGELEKWLNEAVEKAGLDIKAVAN